MNSVNRKEIEDAGKRWGKHSSGEADAILNNGYTAMVENLEEVFDNASAYDLSQYINFFDHWEEDQVMKGGPVYPEKRYERGDIIYADFGAFNFGFELSYPHPCIVISENVHFVLVVPCTTKKCGKNYFDILEGNEEDGLFSHCGTVIDGLRWISKHRIIAKIGKAHDDYVDKIEESLLLFFTHLCRKYVPEGRKENQDRNEKAQQ